MADDKRQQSPEVESRHRILKMSGYAAAAAFCVVSVSANLFGMIDQTRHRK